MKKIFVSIVLAISLIGCSTIQTNTTSESVETASWKEALKLKADKFAVWAQTDKGHVIIQSTAKWSWWAIYRLVPNNTLSTSTKITISNDAYAVSKYLYSKADGSLTADSLEKDIRTFGGSVSIGDYKDIFNLFVTICKDGANLLKGYPAALKSIAIDLAKGTYEAAVAYGATGSNG